MTKSEEIGKLAEALSKAQGEIKGAKKDTNNAFFKHDYADLASVLEACREPLSKYGLSVSQIPVDKEGGGIALDTMLMHSSGQWLCGRITMNPTKNDPQGVGSAITYFRRYTLSAMTGVSQVDDDANAASGKELKPAKPAPRKAEAETEPETLRFDHIPFKGVVEECGVLADDTAAWVKIGDRVCLCKREPYRSKMIESKGKELEMLLIDPPTKTAKGTSVYTVFQVFDTPAADKPPVVAAEADPSFATVDGEMKVCGTVTQIIQRKPGKAFYFKMGSHMFGCFHESLIAHIQKLAEGQRCIFVYKDQKGYHNIERIEKIGDLEFDGGVPVIQMDRGGSHATA